ncbi:MAG: deoxynucleoside kinase [Segetibacter sp.]|nr:deoxynucleoside kinase [Segetibacter sp.]
MTKYKYIAIEGNIGVGKTTLAQILATQIKANLILEKFRNNHFLPLFYNDMKKYGLHVELSFLIDRLEDIESFNENEFVISDYIFSKTLLFAKTNLDVHAYKIFERVYEKFAQNSKNPSLIIYLNRNIEELVVNIEKRGRKSENRISEEYLTNIQNSYDKYFAKSKDLKILSLNVEGIDFNSRRDIVNEVIGLLKNDYKPGITKLRLR